MSRRTRSGRSSVSERARSGDELAPIAGLAQPRSPDPRSLLRPPPLSASLQGSGRGDDAEGPLGAGRVHTAVPAGHREGAGGRPQPALPEDPERRAGPDPQTQRCDPALVRGPSPRLAPQGPPPPGPAAGTRAPLPPPAEPQAQHHRNAAPYRQVRRIHTGTDTNIGTFTQVQTHRRVLYIHT